MPLTVTTAPMTAADLEAVIGIEESSFEQPWSEQSFRTELVKNDLAYYLVARVGERVAGYGGIWVIINEAHLTTLAVERAFRRRGVATAMLQALIDKAVGKGARRITLEVRPSNLAARSLYKKFGFTARGVRKNYYIDEDGLIMYKSLASRSREPDDEPAS